MDTVFSDRISSLKPSAIREILKVTQNSSVISFAAGNPASESFPVAEMADIAKNIFETESAAALQYGVSEGYTPLRDIVRRRLEKRFNAVSGHDDVIIVSGGQQGIELSCKVLANEGDCILCENPSFIGALNAFRSYNVGLHGIPMEDDGIDTAFLKKALDSKKNIKMLYIIPTFQNPSGITMSYEKRRQVYDLCKEYGVFILEDNPYGELRFSGDDIPPIKAMDTHGIVIYCGSFSKILSPGIRVGFLLAPKKIIPKLVSAKQVSDVHTNLFFQMVADRFMRNYDFDGHVKSITDIYCKKCRTMLDAIKEYFPASVKHTNPKGGLFIWCTLPDGSNIDELCKKAVKEGVAIVPGSSFMADPTEPSYTFRLNYSAPSLPDIKKGIKILGQVLYDFLG